MLHLSCHVLDMTMIQQTIIPNKFTFPLFHCATPDSNEGFEVQKPTQKKDHTGKKIMTKLNIDRDNLTRAYEPWKKKCRCQKKDPE